MSTADRIITVDSVGKRFCRRLGPALRYGVADIARELVGRPPPSRLRPDEFWAVEDVSLSLRRGECLGLIGANGAGKSTLLRMIGGLIKPDRGSIAVSGRAGALIDLSAAIHPLLSGRENIRLNAAILGLSRRQAALRIGDIIEFADIGEFIESPVQTYSSGMRVRLGFAIAAHLVPDLLLIDEVLAVGDTAFRMKCFERIIDLRDKGAALVLVSHNSVDVGRVCTQALLLNQGRIGATGDVPTVLATYQETTARWENRDHEAQSAPARIQKVTLHRIDGSPCREIKTGESIYVAITLTATGPAENLRLVVHLHGSELGMLGSFASPASEIWWSCRRETRIHLWLPDLPLLIGAYSISISLYGPERTDFYHERIHATGFRVTGPPVDGFGYGLCHTFRFTHEWRTESCE